MNAALILLIIAAVLFALAAAAVNHPRLHLGWAAATLATLALILEHT